MVTHVIKRAGHSEPFAAHKLEQSLRYATLSVRSLEGEAELIAARVANEVNGWIADKIEVTSRDIRALAGNLLAEIHPEAAYAYDAHDYSL